MVDIGYWLDTFLSQRDEIVTLFLTFVVFGVAAARYNDRRDPMAVFFGTVLLAGTLAFGGPMIIGE